MNTVTRGRAKVAGLVLPRQTVMVNIPTLVAGGTANVVVAGLKDTKVGDLVLLSWPGNMAAGLVAYAHRISAAETLTIRFVNATEATINSPGEVPCSVTLLAGQA